MSHVDGGVKLNLLVQISDFWEPINRSLQAARQLKKHMSLMFCSSLNSPFTQICQLLNSIFSNRGSTRHKVTRQKL